MMANTTAIDAVIGDGSTVLACAARTVPGASASAIDGNDRMAIEQPYPGL